MGNIHPIILGLIVANVLFSIVGFKNDSFFNKFKFQVGGILNGEKHRMFTSAFLHADQMHLAFNMITLYFLGSSVINSFSNVNFLLLYFTSLLAGGMYSLYQNKGNYYYSAVGASGAVSGIVFAFVMLHPNQTLYVPFPVPGYIYGIGYLLYSIYGMKAQLGNIGHSAHLGGAMAGYVITLLFRPDVYGNNKIMVVIMGLIIGGLLLFGDRLKLNP